MLPRARRVVASQFLLLDIPLPTVVYRYMPLHTLIYCCVPLPTVTYFDILGHTRAYSYILGHTLAYSYIPRSFYSSEKYRFVTMGAFGLVWDRLFGTKQPVDDWWAKNPKGIRRGGDAPVEKERKAD